jgi:hypothetical protein
MYWDGSQQLVLCSPGSFRANAKHKSAKRRNAHRVTTRIPPRSSALQTPIGDQSSYKIGGRGAIDAGRSRGLPRRFDGLVNPAFCFLRT